MADLIVRVDDLGFSEAVNYGILKAVQSGNVTSVGLMSNMDAAPHGYDLIRDADLAIGLHTNICVGHPVADVSLIPSLVGENGDFCSSRDIRSRQIDTVDIQEAEIEIEAQLSRFVEIVGRMPDYFEAHAVRSANFFTALKNVALRHQLFYENACFDPEWEETMQMYGLAPVPDQNNVYDVEAFIEESTDFILTHPCTIVIFHPGYIDQYLLDHSSYTMIRPLECAYLCSSHLPDYIKKHHLSLKKLGKPL